jgi:hypothetical protein
MLSDEKHRAAEESEPPSANETQQHAITAGEETSCAAQGVPMDLAGAPQEQPAAKIDFQLEDYFVCQNWHRPYAAVLMETDPVKLATLIAEAERAMASRYLELCVVANTSDELGDLQNASYALSQIKRAIEIAATQQRFVA